MIDGLKPYPAMKDSGVPWLGEVPEHWPIAALRHRYDQALGKMLDSKRITGTHSLPYLRNTDVQWNRINTSSLPTMDIPESEYGRYTLQMGDLLVCEGGEVGRCAIWTGELAVCGYQKALHRLRPRNNDTDLPRFMYYVLRAATKLDAFNDGHVSTIAHLTGDKLRAQRFPYPPFEEQDAIGRFLGHADRRIRRFIRAKQKLMQLLEEQKQAIIHRAVTRGLDPGVRLKPSGVEWLGDVPEHWEVNQIRSIAKVVRGGSPRPAGSPLYFHGTGAPWITVGEVTRAIGMYVTGTTTRLTAAGEERSRTIEPGTLLLTNSGATLGVPKISSIRGCINDGVAALLNIRHRIRREFLHHYLATQTVHLRAWVDLGAQPNLNTQIIGSWPVPIPPTEEQAAIVSHIDGNSGSITDAVSRAHREIELLREYRTRLIADVVTGKLDVRDVAAQLPEAAEDPEMFEEVEVPGDAEEGSTVDDREAEPEDVEA